MGAVGNKGKSMQMVVLEGGEFLGRVSLEKAHHAGALGVDEAGETSWIE
jgi:hypothetical protein